MKSSRALLLLAVAVIALLAWMLLRDPEAPTTAVDARGVAVAESASHELELAEAETATPVARHALETETIAVAAPPATLAPSTWTVRGSVVVLDAEGREHDREDGTVHATDCTGSPTGASQGYTRAIPVRAGAFEYELDEERFLRIGHAELGGKAAVVLEPADCLVIQTAALDPVRILAAWKPRIVLRVIGLDTLQPLSGLTVVADFRPQLDRHGPEPRPLDGGSLRIEHAVSPLEIPISEEEFLERRSWTYFVGAPGYAWGNVRFDLWVGGAETIELRPSGALDVDIAGASTGWPRLTLVATLEPPAALHCEYTRPIERDGRIELDALLPGTYSVETRNDLSPGQAMTLASATVEVFARQRTSVSLLLEPAPLDPLQRVEVSGRLIVPREWNWSMPTLTLVPQSGPRRMSHPPCTYMTRVAESDGVFDWAFSDVYPGTYTMRLLEVAYGEALEVGPEGRSDVVFKIPPPADVLVRVFDEGPATEVEVRHLGWQSGPGPQDSALFDADARGYRFRAPVGAIDVAAFADCHDHALRSHRFQVAPGTNEFVIALELPTGVRLVLRDGRRELTSPWETSIEGIDGGTCNWISGGGEGKHFYVDRPGRYRVVIPSLEGYEPILDQIVDVRLGEMTPLIVELVRKP